MVKARRKKIWFRESPQSSPKPRFESRHEITIRDAAVRTENAGPRDHHPASFTGQITGQTTSLTVSLTDADQVLGPVTLIHGKEPKMGPCPVCSPQEEQ